MITINTILVCVCWFCAGAMAGILWRKKHLGLWMNLGVGAVGWYLSRVLLSADYTIPLEVDSFLIEGVLYSTLGSWIVLMIISLLLKITVSKYQMD